MSGPLDEQCARVLLHMLGLTRSESPYRNHYVAGPGHHSSDALDRLVGAGLVEATRRPGFLLDDSINYRATDAGRAVALAEKERRRPRLTRSQERYRRWIDSGCADSGWPFGDWIKAGCP